MRELFSQPPEEDARTLQAALRSCFPDAMTDVRQFEDAVANVSFMYVAGFETTSNAVVHTLSALAIDQDSQALLVEVRPAAAELVGAASGLRLPDATGMHLQ